MSCSTTSTNCCLYEQPGTTIHFPAEASTIASGFYISISIALIKGVMLPFEASTATSIECPCEHVRVSSSPTPSYSVNGADTAFKTAGNHQPATMSTLLATKLDSTASAVQQLNSAVSKHYCFSESGIWA